MIEAFLWMALAAPSPQFHHGIVSYRAIHDEVVSYEAVNWHEEEIFRDFINRYSPGADIVIGPVPTPENMRRNGWEQTPFYWNGQEVWIRRKPVDDRGRGRVIPDKQKSDSRRNPNLDESATNRRSRVAQRSAA